MKKKLGLKQFLLLMMTLKAMPVLGSGPNIHGLLETGGVQDAITEYHTFDDLCALAQTNKKLNKIVNSRWLWPFNFKTEAEFQESFNKMSLRFLPLSFTFHLPSRTPEILNMIPETKRFSKRRYENILAAFEKDRDYFTTSLYYPDSDLDPDSDSFACFVFIWDIYTRKHSDMTVSIIGHLDQLRERNFKENFKNKQIIWFAMDLLSDPRIDKNYQHIKDLLRIPLSFDLEMPHLVIIWEKFTLTTFDHDLKCKFFSQKKLKDPLRKQVKKYMREHRG